MHGINSLSALVQAHKNSKLIYPYPHPSVNAIQKMTHHHSNGFEAGPAPVPRDTSEPVSRSHSRALHTPDRMS